jgi:coniferyl-aldehyde dehydrogenase
VTQLPLDHILFTGSTQVGRLVAKAAAENLVPCTLELGGKSPALVHPDYDVRRAAERIAVGKCFNAGQTCIAPDYALVPEGKEASFAEAFKAAVARHWPDLATTEQYTAMATPRGHERMKALLEDAKAKGARVEPVAPHGEPKEGRKVAPTLVFGVTEQMKLMEEEIFGPILPVKTYRTLEEALDYVRAHPRPLAFYYFDHDEPRAEQTLARTVSGGACINDTLVHFAQERLPFGGVGASGMGAYHGEVGFQTFSHARSVLVSSPLAPARRVLAPPYGRVIDKAIDLMVGWVGKLIG